MTDQGIKCPSHGMSSLGELDTIFQGSLHPVKSTWILGTGCPRQAPHHRGYRWIFLGWSWSRCQTVTCYFRRSFMWIYDICWPMWIENSHQDNWDHHTALEPKTPILHRSELDRQGHLSIGRLLWAGWFKSQWWYLPLWSPNRASWVESISETKGT